MKSPTAAGGHLARSPRDEYAIFETGFGSCAIAWRGERVRAVQLPGRTREATRRRLLRVTPGARETAAPSYIVSVSDRISAILEGKGTGVTFADVALDLSGVTPFYRAVLLAARELPPGETVTYGWLATHIGHPRSARVVGAALGRNPVPIIVPCHRVVAANGKTGGFSAPGGVATKIRLLASERGFGALFAQR